MLRRTYQIRPVELQRALQVASSCEAAILEFKPDPWGVLSDTQHR